MQKDQERPCSPSPQTHPVPEERSSNGRSVLGRGLTLGHCRGLGAGNCGPGPGRMMLVQELSDLEGQIQVIKQQLQAAMRRKQELEQFQSEHQQAKPTAPGLSTAHRFTQHAQDQAHQQSNKHTNTAPEF